MVHYFPDRIVLVVNRSPVNLKNLTVTNLTLFETNQHFIGLLGMNPLCFATMHAMGTYRFVYSICAMCINSELTLIIAGMKELSPPSVNLKRLFEHETLPEEPILIVISPGADPSQELQDLANETIGHDRYHQVGDSYLPWS